MVKEAWEGETGETGENDEADETGDTGETGAVVVGGLVVMGGAEMVIFLPSPADIFMSNELTRTKASDIVDRLSRKLLERWRLFGGVMVVKVVVMS
jgi:hypothetical protein